MQVIHDFTEILMGVQKSQFVEFWTIFKPIE